MDKEIFTRQIHEEIKLAQCPKCGLRSTFNPGRISKGIFCANCEEKTMGPKHIVAVYKIDKRKTDKEILEQSKTE